MIYLFIVGTERTAREIQEVFDHIIAKAPTEVPFVFTRRLFTSVSELSCVGHGKQFCQHENIRSLLQSHLTDLPKSKNDWETKEGKYRRLALLIWLGMHNAQMNEEQFKPLFKEILDLTDSLLVKNSAADFKMLFDRIPTIAYIEFWIRDTQDISSCNNHEVYNIRCLFFDLYSILSKYSKFISKNPKTKHVETLTDHKEGLRLQKLNNIKDKLTRNVLEIKKTISELSLDLKKFFSERLDDRFSALGKHFEKMASYDLQKATADVGFIRTKLKDFEDEVKTITNQLKPKLTKIINYALSSTIGNLAFHVSMLLIEVFANMNPLKHIFGQTDPRAMLEAQRNVAAAGVKVAEATKLKSILMDVLNMGQVLKEGFQKNAAFQKNTDALVTKISAKLNTPAKVIGDDEVSRDADEFLDKYAEYSPNVTLAQIEQQGSLLESLVEDGCALIKDDVTVGSAVQAGIMASTGNCLTTKSDIVALVTTYSEMYQYQFDLMESLAEVVRSYTAFTSAKTLQKKFKTSIKSGFKKDAQLDLLLIQMRLSSRLHRLLMVNNLCDYEEYMRGGVEPRQCKVARSTLSDTSIDALVALSKSTCLRKRSDFVNIPTKPQHENDTAYINLDALYSGNGAIFQIPDAVWLARYNWIFPDDVTNHAYYLEDMQLYLPDDIKGKRKVRITVTPISAMKLFPTSAATQYALAGTGVKQIGFEYREPGQGCDQTRKKNNPYDNCEGKKVCIKSTTTERKVSPSVFAKWKIKSSIWSISGKRVKPSVKFATNVTLRAFIKMCVVKSGATYGSSPTKKPEVEYKVFHNTDKCCNKEVENGYWNSIMDKCETCPRESWSSTAGTYCRRKCWKPCKKKNGLSKSGRFFFNGCWQPFLDRNKAKNMTGTFCRID